MKAPVAAWSSLSSKDDEQRDLHIVLRAVHCSVTQRLLFCRRTPVQSVRTVCTDPTAKTQHEWFQNAQSLTAPRLGVLMRAEQRSPSRIALSEGDSSWLPFLAPCTICPDWKDLLLKPQGIYTILQPQGEPCTLLASTPLKRALKLQHAETYSCDMSADLPGALARSLHCQSELWKQGISLVSRRQVQVTCCLAALSTFFTSAPSERCWQRRPS